jgi:hypothetical protein
MKNLTSNVPSTQSLKESTLGATSLRATKVLTALSVAAVMTSAVFAGSTNKKVIVAPQQDLFRAGEVQLDAFVAGAAGKYAGPGVPGSGNRTVTGMGGGLGLSYFFTRCFAIGLDDTLGGLNGSGNTFNNLQGNLIARIPIESLHLAPYAIAGGGATWGNNNTQGNGNVGGGLEYRVNRGFGLFADSRYLYGNRGLNESLTRAGLRFIF